MTTIGNTSRPAYVYDAQTDAWIPIGVGPHTHEEYIEKTVITAKGDILVGTASDAVAKLGVGPEGSVLIVDPTSPTGLAWGEAGGSIGVSEDPPEDPTEGNVWFNASEGTSYIYYDGFWVPLSPAVTGPRGEPGFEASDTEPSDTGILWLDTDEEADIPVPAGGTTGQVLQKTSNNDYETAWGNPSSGNAIINGAFDFWQRGTSFTSPASDTYVTDRFKQFTGGTGATRIFSQQTFTPGAAPLAGLEGQFFLRMNQTVAGTGDTFNQIHQRIEDVRTFAGQTVTISFYAKAASAITVTPFLEQIFGTGGSTAVNTSATACNITTSWQRFTRTVSVPSIAGKTIGTNSSLALALFVPNNATFTFDLWGVQVEAGSTATPFRRNANSRQGELAACQRYYSSFRSPVALFAYIGSGYVTGSTEAKVIINHPVEMRATPTFSSTSATNLQVLTPNTRTVTSLVLDMATPRTTGLFVNTASGMTAGHGALLIGNNSNNWLLEFSAEL